MTLAEKIAVQSISQQFGVTYQKPDVLRMKKFIEDLWSDNTALDYLHITRGFTDETIKHFSLGYDSERNAIAIPVYKREELINIKYRLIEPGDKPKYTQEKGCEVWIYNEEGIQEAIKKGGVLIVEGEFDLISAYQAGFKNVVSPASGKDSYGIWIEMLDNIPKVYISYDNDKPGKEAGKKMAERIGVEKCFEVFYEEGIKDANDYFKKYTSEDFKGQIRKARPFYTYQFRNIATIIDELRSDTGEKITTKFLPDVKLSRDALVVVSAQTNVGKTMAVLNMAKEFVEKDIPVLVLPFERGSQVVGERYLQIMSQHTEEELRHLDNGSWEKIIAKILDIPLYFAMPKKDDTIETIKKAKRMFGIKVCIIDHLDYMVRSATNKEAEISSTLQNLKRVGEENEIIFLVVTHIRKINTPGAKFKKNPQMDDLKGSSSLQQDPEVVAMLTSPEEGFVKIKIEKNKGKMSERTYRVNYETGVMSTEISKLFPINNLPDKNDDFDGW